MLTDRLQLVHLCASNACTSAVGTFRTPAYRASINSIVAGVAATLCVFRALGHLGAASAEPARRNRPLLRDVLPGVTSALRVFEAEPLMLGYVMTQSALISRDDDDDRRRGGRAAVRVHVRASTHAADRPAGAG
ncbi:hypothetical protein WM29_16445 [Burkholderia ubonensis]|uniref:hypothetical protein n=1 Tax=Burkholderia ubonensis TaxID=101571 RepID=UPI000841B58A|nr:hypothetical protein [Burkholderia ubonensis]AOK60842.1 hypothetical protein WM29_16445 [Burkholderia ubonensis]